jgi:hypothetical protein
VPPIRRRSFGEVLKSIVFIILHFLRKKREDTKKATVFAAVFVNLHRKAEKDWANLPVPAAYHIKKEIDKFVPLYYYISTLKTSAPKSTRRKGENLF